MKVTLGNLVLSLQSGSLQKLVNDGALPFKTNYRLAKIWKQIQAEVKDYDEQRIGIAKEFGTLNAETNVYEFLMDDAQKQFNDAMNSLGELEIEIAGEVFTPSDFEPRKITAGDFLTASDLCNLDWLIVDPAFESNNQPPLEFVQKAPESLNGDLIDSPVPQTEAVSG